MFNNYPYNRKARITFGLIGGVEKGVMRKYTDFNIKYRAVFYFIFDILFLTVLQLILGHGLLTVEASLSVRHAALCRTPFDEGSARRRCLYFTTHNAHKKQTSMHPAEFEPGIPACRDAHTRLRSRDHWSVTHNKYCFQII